ncbi:MAG: CIA30 family protein [Cyanobacteriota bacterium]|nr:CIA30 family protein [Cyanobacteriota bacterium]
MPSAEQLPADRVLFSGEGFAGWHALNDPIMGGRSSGSVAINSGDGLIFNGEVVEQGGGFISVRSPLLSPPLDLAAFAGFGVVIGGDGRRFKLAVACADGVAGLTNLIPGGLRWVTEFATDNEGLTVVRIPWETLTASVRAQPVKALPLGYVPRFDPTRITRLQLLHSKFDDAGGLNSGFRAGPIRLVLQSISAIAGAEPLAT